LQIPDLHTHKSITFELSINNKEFPTKGIKLFVKTTVVYINAKQTVHESILERWQRHFIECFKAALVFIT